MIDVTSNGDRETVAAEDVARAEAAVVLAQTAHDAARRHLTLAELDLRRAEQLRDTARSYYHGLRTPTRQHSAIGRATSE